MKIRLNYVSNSSSSSFVTYIRNDLVENFRNDFENFQNCIREIFPQWSEESFWYEISQPKTERELTLDYLKEQEGVKRPTNDMLEFFTKKLKERKYFDEYDGKCQLKYYVDTEDYDSLGFQELCQCFIEKYDWNKKNE